jgi:serine/threonine protein kinase
MRLSSGDKLGPYEIRGLIGKGGMGEVYHGSPHLDHVVTIKVSPDKFSSHTG